MINCIFMANFYHLVIDDSVNKRYQIAVIILQCAISIGVYFLILNVGTSNALFYITFDINSDPPFQALFFGSIFFINPLVVLMLFLFMSFQKSILVKDRRIKKKEEADKEIK
jgi:hypothetical protein